MALTGAEPTTMSRAVSQRNASLDRSERVTRDSSFLAFGPATTSTPVAPVSGVKMTDPSRGMYLRR